MTSIPRDVVALPPGAGLAVPNAAPGRDLIVKALQSDTGGAYSRLEWSTTGDLWVPAHIHHGEEEAWYVLEGELTFRIGERTIPAPAGSFVLVPPGTPHSFANTGGGTARFLELFSPGGMERYFEERAAMRRDAPSSGPDMTALAELGRRYGIERVWGESGLGGSGGIRGGRVRAGSSSARVSKSQEALAESVPSIPDRFGLARLPLRRDYDVSELEVIAEPR